MKTLHQSLAIAFLSLCTSAVFAAVPPIDVTVTDASGKVAFKGKTNSAGAFATPKLSAAEYIVQFKSSNLTGTHAIAVSGGGLKKVVADSVTADQFKGGGVAMKVKVGNGTSITGSVSELNASSDGNPRVKIVNGKRWFLVKGATGSHLGDHWVEEGSPEAREMGSYSRDAIQNMQEKAKGSPNGG